MACCKGHHQLTASAPAPSARLFLGHLSRGGRGAARSNRSPGATRASPGASRAPLGLFQASLQLPASPEILRLLWLETRPSGRCPSLPVCPRPTPTSLCASVPLLCLEDVGPKPGTEGSPLRPGQSFADDVFVKS